MWQCVNENVNSHVSSCLYMGCNICENMYLDKFYKCDFIVQLSVEMRLRFKKIERKNFNYLYVYIYIYDATCNWSSEILNAINVILKF